MTEEWFRDLAERLRDAAEYATFEGRSSFARELSTAERAAAELASAIRTDLLCSAHPSRGGRSGRHHRSNDDGRGTIVPSRRPST